MNVSINLHLEINTFKEYLKNTRNWKLTLDFFTLFDYLIMIFTKQSMLKFLIGCDWLVTEMASDVRLSSNTSRFSTNEKTDSPLIIKIPQMQSEDSGFFWYRSCVQL